MKIEINRVSLADSYKYSHASQYPKNMVSMFDYMESRGGVFPATVFVGLQGLLKTYFAKPIEMWEVDEAYEMAKMHGVPFDYEGWRYIAVELEGKLPIEIRAVKEGSVIPVRNVLMTIESTDPKVPWIAGWMETILMRLWYPINVATKSYFVKQMLMDFGSPEWAQFAYHNFGSRGSSTTEASMIGGFAHLTQFMGTDNFDSLFYCKRNYGADIAGFSVFATEHSTTTANAEGSKKKEIAFIERMLIENPDAPIMSFVADSYDIYNFTEKVTAPNSWIRETIESRPNQKFVIRPDSGEPLEVISKMLEIMEQNDVFDSEIDGFKVSSNYGILWGDGITPNTIEDILTMVMRKGYAAENFVFGSGGDLMQNHTRDTQKFAIKCSSIAIESDDELIEVDVFKDPITDPGKKSKKGRITTYRNADGEYFVDKVDAELDPTVEDVLEVVYKDGELVRETTLEEIRDISNESY